MFKLKYCISKKILIILFSISLFGSSIIAMNYDIPRDVISKLAKYNAKSNYLTDVAAIPEIQTLILGYLSSSGCNKYFELKLDRRLSNYANSAFSSDAQRIAISMYHPGHVNCVHICDTQSKSIVKSFETESRIDAILYSMRDQYLVLGTPDAILIYDMSNSKYIQKISVAARNICFSHNGLYFAYCHDKSLKIIDFNNLIKAKPLDYIDHKSIILEHENILSQFIFMKNNRHIISLEPHKINILDMIKDSNCTTNYLNEVTTDFLVQKLIMKYLGLLGCIKQIDEANVESLTPLPNGNLFATAAKDKIKIWEISKNNEECKCKCKIDISDSVNIRSILFSNCGKYLAAFVKDCYNNFLLKVFFFYNELENFCIFNVNNQFDPDPHPDSGESIQFYRYTKYTKFEGALNFSPCNNYLLLGRKIYELKIQALEVLDKLKDTQKFSNSSSYLLSNLVDTIKDSKYGTLQPFDYTSTKFVDKSDEYVTMHYLFYDEESKEIAVQQATKFLNPKCIVCDAQDARLKCKFECNLVNYCSRECKNSNWHEHIKFCPNNRVDGAKQISEIEKVDKDEFDNADDKKDDNNKRDEEEW